MKWSHSVFYMSIPQSWMVGSCVTRDIWDRKLLRRKTKLDKPFILTLASICVTLVSETADRTSNRSHAGFRICNLWRPTCFLIAHSQPREILTSAKFLLYSSNLTRISGKEGIRCRRRVDCGSQLSERSPSPNDHPQPCLYLFWKYPHKSSIFAEAETSFACAFSSKHVLQGLLDLSLMVTNCIQLTFIKELGQPRLS